jgi:hypothetical protein
MSLRSRKSLRSALVLAAAAPAVIQAVLAAPASAGARCSHVNHTHWHGETHWHTHTWEHQYSFNQTINGRTTHHEMFYLGTGSHDTYQSKGPCDVGGHAEQIGVISPEIEGDPYVYSPLDEAQDPFLEGGDVTL